MTDAALLSDREAEQVVRLYRVLSAGLSGIEGLEFRPGPGWAADLEKGILYYDLGLAAKLIKAGKRRAVTAVSGHEVGHLVFSTEVNKQKLPFASRSTASQYRLDFHKLINALEDRRMELLMGKANPGLVEDFLLLQHAVTDTVEWQELVKNASPPVQFYMNALLTAYGRDCVTSLTAVQESMDRHRAAILKMVKSSKDTQALARAVCRSGLWDDMVALIEATPSGPESAADSSQEGEQKKGDSGAGQAAQSKSKSKDDKGKGSDSQDKGDCSTGSAEPGQSGGSNDTGKDEEQPRLDKEALSQLTKHHREMLDDAINDALGRDPRNGIARDLRDDLQQLDNELGEINAKFNLQKRHAAWIEDDRKWASATPRAELYETYARKYRGQISTLARDLQSVLLENSFDRYNGAFRTGDRLNSGKLAGIRAGNFAVFKRRISPKNRKYAVALLQDVSSSMLGLEIFSPDGRNHGTALQVAHEACVLLLEALDQAGIKSALYVFGADVTCVKAFESPLELRKGRIGAVTAHLVSGATCMGWALKRVGSDLLSSFPGDEWRKIVIVVTDGQPNSCALSSHAEARDPKPFIRELEAQGVTVVGIGLRTNSVRRYFSKSFVLTEVAALGRLFAQIMRDRVRKG
jgi:hypothetical protein